MGIIKDIIDYAGSRAMEENNVCKEEANLKVVMAEYKRIMDEAEAIHVKTSYMMVFLTGVIAALSLLIPIYIKILSNVDICSGARWIGFSLMLAAGIFCLVTFYLALEVYKPDTWKAYNLCTLRMADRKYERPSDHIALIVDSYRECIDGPLEGERQEAKPPYNREIMKMKAARFHLTCNFLAATVVFLVFNTVYLLIIYAPIK